MIFALRKYYKPVSYQQMLFDISKINLEVLNDELFSRKQVTVAVLRLDQVHPVLSGNKLFKLHYFLEEALQSDHKTIITFGGAYSNHLAATAYACASLKLKCIGVVRGEKPAMLSHTLQQCSTDGMLLKFVSRQQFAEKENDAFIKALQSEFGKCTIVPEGGYHPLGAKGAALIMGVPGIQNYSHICTATGTATTLAGLLAGAEGHQTIISVPVLKGMTDIEERIKFLTGIKSLSKNLRVLNEYHFGGYAKKTDDLIEFMNRCRQHYHLPLDFVYTAKMFYAVLDCIKKNNFPEGSNILCVHTGGLQGNKSLPLNTLLF